MSFFSIPQSNPKLCTYGTYVTKTTKYSRVLKYPILQWIINLVTNSLSTTHRYWLLNGQLLFSFSIFLASWQLLKMYIYYKNNLFEHPELTRIVGEPTTATLIALQAEVCDNVQSIQSDLGGSANGHLGLVCTPQAYSSLVTDATPYLSPMNPGRLQIANGLTQHSIAQVREQHQEATRGFVKSLMLSKLSFNNIYNSEDKYCVYIFSEDTDLKIGS